MCVCVYECSLVYECVCLKLRILLVSLCSGHHWWWRQWGLYTQHCSKEECEISWMCECVCARMWEFRKILCESTRQWKSSATIKHPSTFFLFCSLFLLLLILFFIFHYQSDESDAKVRSRHTSHLMCFFMKLFIKHMKHYKWLFTLTEICSDKATGYDAAITIQFTPNSKSLTVQRLLNTEIFNRADSCTTESGFSSGLFNKYKVPNNSLLNRIFLFCYHLSLVYSLIFDQINTSFQNRLNFFPNTNKILLSPNLFYQ